jgi:hypothetical protein
MEKETKTNSLRKDLNKTLTTIIIIMVILIVLYFLNLKTEMLTKIAGFIIQ